MNKQQRTGKTTFSHFMLTKSCPPSVPPALKGRGWYCSKYNTLKAAHWLITCCWIPSCLSCCRQLPAGTDASLTEVRPFHLKKRERKKAQKHSQWWTDQPVATTHYNHGSPPLFFMALIICSWDSPMWWRTLGSIIFAICWFSLAIWDGLTFFDMSPPGGQAHTQTQSYTLSVNMTKLKYSVMEPN